MPIFTPPSGSSKGSTLAIAQYAPATAASVNIGSATWTAIFPTELGLTFIAPASGQVLLKFTFPLTTNIASNVNSYLGYSTSSTTFTQVGIDQYIVRNFATTGVVLDHTFQQLLTGLTPGTSYTLYPWMQANSGNGGTLYIQGAKGVAGFGPAIFEVISQ